MVLVAVVATVLSLPPIAVTAVGARRRGLAWPVAVLAGVAFPVTWGVWYVRDEHPYRQPQRQQI